MTLFLSFLAGLLSVVGAIIAGMAINQGDRGVATLAAIVSAGLMAGALALAAHLQ